MSEETLAAPTAPAQNTAVVITTTDEPALVKPEATEDAGQTPESAEARPVKTAEQRELESLRRKNTKHERSNYRLHQEMEQLRARLPEPQGEAQPGQVDPVALADHIATAREVAKQSNDVVKEGQKRFAATWAASLAAVLDEAGPLIDSKSMLPTPLGEAILDSKDPSALLHHLGSDPSLAAELADLSPAKLGRRLAQIEAQMETPKPKPASNAPPPINPLNGNASPNVFDPETSDFASYEREREKRGARYSGRRL